MVQSKPQQVLNLSSSAETQSGVDKKLCIEIGAHFYSFCISDTSGKQIMELGCYETTHPVGPDELNHLFDHDKIKHQSFVDVVLVHNNRAMALVPSTFHQTDINTTILQTIHGDVEDWNVMEDDVHQWELFAVYGWKPELIAVVAERFPQVRYVQFVTGALRSLFKSPSIEKEQLIKLYFYQKEMMVVVLKESQLLLAQSFHFDTPQDVVYHLLNIVDRLQLDLATIQLEVGGLIDVRSETWKELHKFFIEVQLDEPINFSMELNGSSLLPAHYYTPFLITPRCV